jgi:hypothetical protein
MEPPHFDDPWLEEEQQQSVARPWKKGGRPLVAASGDVQLPLQLGQHLTGAAVLCQHASSHQILTRPCSVKVKTVLIGCSIFSQCWRWVALSTSTPASMMRSVCGR